MYLSHIFTTRSSTRHRPISLHLEALEPRCLLSSLPDTPGVGGESRDAVTVGTSTVLFSVTSGNSLYRHTDGSGWVKLGDNVTSVSAVAEASGNVVVFALTADHALGRFDDVSGWQMIGAPGTVTSISAGTDRNGHADAFVTTADGTFTEYSGSSGWLTSPLGAPGSILAWSALSNDRVLAVTADHSVMEHDDTFGWFTLAGPGFAQSVSGVTEASGHVVVYAITGDKSLFRHDDATGWTRLGAAGTIASISAGTDASGLTDTAVLTTAGDLLENDTASGWLFVRPPGPVSEANATSLERIFFILSDGSVFGHDPQFGSYRMTSIGFAVT